jgi:4-hydroxybenzoate polyprenyltransferase
LYLSVPVLLFLLAYSFTKRFTILSHVWLGAALMLAPLAAWIAICGLVDLFQPVLLGLAVLAWVTGFDIIYACQDVDIDRSAGLFSIPAHIGVRNALRVAATCHLGMIGFLIALGFMSPYLGSVYFFGVAAVAVLLVYEHWLVKPSDLTRVNISFFYVNGIISVGMLAVLWLQLAVNG